MNRRAFLVGGVLAAAAATVVRSRPGARADLDFASAGEVARAIQRGDVSSVELTGHALERIKRHNPRAIGLTSDGLPIGLQVIGPYLEDLTPIDITGRLGEVVGGFRRPGGYA